MLHEVRYVLGAIAQRWQDQRDDRQAIVQVLSKSPVLNHGFEISMCSGDYPHVHLSRLRRSDLLDFPVLYQLLDHLRTRRVGEVAVRASGGTLLSVRRLSNDFYAESKMRVSILGSGFMGGKLRTAFERAGHQAVFSYARSHQKLQKLAREPARLRKTQTPFCSFCCSKRAFLCTMAGTPATRNGRLDHKILGNVLHCQHANEMAIMHYG